MNEEIDEPTLPPFQRFSLAGGAHVDAGSAAGGTSAAPSPSRLEACLERLRARGEGAFMPFLVIGDPDYETSLELTERLIRAGADLLEFGLAFSDPPADGPVIQAADNRALTAGINTEKAIVFLGEVRRRTERPIALLVYYNLVLRHGVDRFFRRMAEAGVDAVLIADLPVEEADFAIKAANAYRVAPIFIVSELTSAERLAKILPVARGYLYLVARLGVTGERGQIDAALTGTIGRLKQLTPLPLLAGFGISAPEQVRQVMAAGADGAICGSAIIGRIERHLEERAEMLLQVERFARDMKEATRRG